MTDEAKNEYMRGVRWTTALYVFVSTVSIIISIVWFAAGIEKRQDVSDITNKNERLALEGRLNARIDTVIVNQIKAQNKNDIQFQRIQDELENKPHPGYFERYIKGKLTYIPAK